MPGNTIAYLRVLKGAGQGRVYVLKDLSVFDLGRDPSSTVAIDDDSVCSTHARIYRKGEVWTFFDLNSDAGSWVNDIPVKKRDLDGGEILRLGRVELHFGFEKPVPKKGKSPAQSHAAEAPADSVASKPTPPPPAAAPTQAPVPAPVVREVQKTRRPVTVARDFDVVQPQQDDTLERVGALLTNSNPHNLDRTPTAEPPESPAGLAGFDLETALREAALRPVSALPEMRLRVINGDSRDIGKEVILLRDSECVLGRSTSAQLVLNDGKVSRLHCRIESRDGGFLLTDLNSANGTVVNGERVSQAQLGAGDYLRVGFTLLVYEAVPMEVI